MNKPTFITVDESRKMLMKNPEDAGKYRVRLDGQVIAWAVEVDTERGYVDVFMKQELPPFALTHRLFGVVTLEQIT